ncbi:divergent polysaccharide deacetylase family protein [Ectothiorhodospira mobilis]|uniref:divergent polysaccharide deacetylase family protein n=1 Tax=Ectothiorhodospira mobilis TaxID=195064 RepID=UPI00190530A8|nr:divergent polysaccharide deacetylase family protein [Ectothiorhodospira mobilis]
MTRAGAIPASRRAAPSRAWILLLALWAWSAWGPVWGDDGAAPVIAIVIDDLGNDLESARRIAALPAPVTVAVLPFSPYAGLVGGLVQENGHEVMLHLPMEADGDHDPGPGAIRTRLNEAQTRRLVRRALERVPQARGMNNHMGSRLSRSPHHLAWIMSELLAHDPGLYVLDSRTHVQTRIQQVARWAGLKNTRRDVFLDARPHDAGFARRQLEHLARLARTRGQALGIGHPHPQTLAALEAMLPRLQAQGFELVTVSRYLWQQEEIPQWHASLSPSPPAAKNSKPSP